MTTFDRQSQPTAHQPARRKETPMTSPARPIRLYRHALSGHSHRVELFLSLLRLPFELVDLAKGAHKAPDFLPRSFHSA
jgi:glutathione S-transferase